MVYIAFAPFSLHRPLQEFSQKKIITQLPVAVLQAQHAMAKFRFGCLCLADFCRYSGSSSDSSRLARVIVLDQKSNRLFP